MIKVKKFLRPLNLIVLFCGILLIALGVLVIFGWYTNNPLLIQIHPSFVPMQFNTASGFLIFGLCLVFLSLSKKNLVKSLSILLILLGTLTLFQYIVNLSFGIDEILMKHYITVETSHPGRMAPNTALNFILSGLSFLILSIGRTRKKVFLSSCISAIVFGLGAVAFLGYLSNVESAHGWGKYTHMAIHTATGFMFGGISIILLTFVISIKYKLKTSYFSLSFFVGIAGITFTLAIWQALGTSQFLREENVSDLIVFIWIKNGILLLGFGLSISLTIILWIAYRFWEELLQLKKAKKKILLLNQKLKNQSFLDPLTGIPNRRALNARLLEEIPKAIQENFSIAVVLIDIDFFKKYNDYYGHQQGDKCLIEFAKNLQHLINWETDFVARYGGEEFVVIFSKVNSFEVEIILGKIKNTFKENKMPHANSNVSNYITFSAGICVGVPGSLDDIENYFLYADDALYRAKSNGRDQFVINEFKVE